MKFRYVEILDDPHALLESALSLVDEHRVPDNDLIEAMLAALQASGSLVQFYVSYIQDTKGMTRQVSECALKARELLDKRERDYIEFVTRIRDYLPSLETDLNDPQEQHRLILSLADGAVRRQKRKRSLGVGVPEEIMRGTYAYYAYILYRALFYLRRGNTKIDKNDFEDAQICKHLRPDTPFHLVTNDNALIETIQQVISLMQNITDPAMKNGFLQVSNLSHLKEIASRQEINLQA